MCTAPRKLSPYRSVGQRPSEAASQGLALMLLVCGVLARATAQEPAPPAASSADGAVSAPLSEPSKEFLRDILLLIKAKRYDEARQRLEPAVQQHPDSHVALFYLALTYHKQQRYAEARPLYDRVAGLQPDYKEVLMFHGWCLYYLGEPAAAQAKFSAFLATRPDYADAHFALGLIAFDDDRMEEARTRLQQAIDFGQASRDVAMESKARARLGDVLMRLADLPAARQEFERSVALNPDNYEVYFKLSRALQRLGDEEGAARARRLHDEVRERVRPSEPPGERRPGE